MSRRRLAIRRLAMRLHKENTASERQVPAQLAAGVLVIGALAG
jgi:hypothetical protein